MAKSTSKIAKSRPAVVPAASGGMTAEDRAREKKWRTESDLRTLREAEEIRCDRSRMRDAKAMATKEAAALRKIK